ncbi:MAG TPA: flagellar basal body P-ring protein FlgI [Tepidisphaeraceae bacterium]|jgi:flagellar P-ring protein precursor FlgI
MRRTVVLILLALLLIPGKADAVKVADITRIGGQRTNVLTGLGLVYGLHGSGDGGDFLPAIKPLASMLSKFADSATVLELNNVQNVALVSVTATVPSNGARDGDHIDVYITSIGAAKSLRGGRLFVTPMQGPVPGSGIFALAEGPVVLEDPSTPTVGVVKGGCVMEADLPAKYIEQGRFTLILEDPSASWTMASTIAKIINDAGDGDVGETLAVAADPKNVVVTIPKSERDRPDSFISRVQRLPVPMLPTEARVTINDRTGTIIMTGDVEISPVVISHKGLTITTINPEPVPSARFPVISTKEVVAIDTTNQGGGKLQDLVNALDQLKVPAEDRISIVKELYKTGKLHAKLIVE